MRSRDGTDICVACRSSREVKESNQMNNNGMEEDNQPISSSMSNNLGEASSSSSFPNKRSRTLLNTDGIDKFNLPNDVWRSESVPRMLRETVKTKLSWASSRLAIDSIGCLSLLESCINLLNIMDTDLSDAPEYMITMLNLEKFVESEQKKMSECGDIQECNRICDTIYLTLKMMKNLDQANVTKLNPL